MSNIDFIICEFLEVKTIILKHLQVHIGIDVMWVGHPGCGGNVMLACGDERTAGPRTKIVEMRGLQAENQNLATTHANATMSVCTMNFFIV